MNKAPLPLIYLEGISRTYPGVVPVFSLRSFELRVNAGDFISVRGPSGSGKSTFLNLVGLLDRPTLGNYWFADKEMNSLSERDRTAFRSHSLGFIFQSFHLINHRSAQNNVELGLVYKGCSPTEMRARASEALALVTLAHKTAVRASELSGGEQQRVAIARAVVGRPRLLLCDEPTGNLDSVSSEVIMNLLFELNARGTTIILITHDQAIAERAQRHLFIRDGWLSEGR